MHKFLMKGIKFNDFPSVLCDRYILAWNASPNMGSYLFNVKLFPLDCICIQWHMADTYRTVPHKKCFDTCIRKLLCRFEASEWTKKDMDILKQLMLTKSLVKQSPSMHSSTKPTSNPFFLYKLQALRFTISYLSTICIISANCLLQLFIFGIFFRSYHLNPTTKSGLSCHSQ